MADFTPRERVERVLAGRRIDRVPFTMYENKIPQCTTERLLRSRGLCIIVRTPVFRVHRPNVQVVQKVTWQGDHKFVRTTYETPEGTLTTLGEEGIGTTWVHERMFKSPDDYRTLRFLLQDEQYEPAYEAFDRRQRLFGSDALLRASIGSEPLQALISGPFIGMQEFCIQWMDHRDEILRLYDVIVENRRRQYPLVAASPTTHANYGGNVTPQIVSPQMFEQYYAPHYDEAAAVMHEHGKQIGSHFDDNCRLLAEGIGRTALDYIEAFTPAPDTDMTLAEARRAWPDKVLWINFPSSVHLQESRQVFATTLELLAQVPTVEGLIMGVTEDVPEDHWQRSCTAIVDALDHHAVRCVGTMVPGTARGAAAGGQPHHSIEAPLRGLRAGRSPEDES